MSLLPHSTCVAQGVDARGIDDFIRATRDLGVELHELVVVRHGQVVAQTAWSPWRADVRQLVHSVTKTLVSMAVGLCIDDGHLSVDDRFVGLFPEAAPFAEGIDQITVHHLLSMTTGHTEDTLLPMLAEPAERWWQAFAATPIDKQPGEWFIYHNGASNVLAEIVRRASGREITDLLDERVMGPLGIPPLTWKTDPAGRAYGFSGAFLTAEEMAVIGELLLRDGVWNGRRLLPEGWVDEMRRPHADTSPRENPHGALGYGYQVWQGFEGFRLDGAAGQYVLVLPEREAVVALTAGSWPAQTILDLAQRLLVPALGGGEQHGEPSALTGLRVPATTGHPVGREAAYAGVPRAIDRAPLNAPWRYPTVRDPRLDAHRVLHFTTDHGPARVSCGNAVWQESELALGDTGVRVAARAVQDATSVVVDVAFIETPFRLTLRFFGHGDATQTWNSAIVHTDGLAGLGAPR